MFSVLNLSLSIYGKEKETTENVPFGGQYHSQKYKTMVSKMKKVTEFYM